MSYWKDEKKPAKNHLATTTDEEIEPPSKTAVKKEMLALQKLGEALVNLSNGELKTIPIDDDTLAYAIQTARRIQHREGRRRQMQYIGKLMRKVDITNIKNAYQQLLDGHKEKTNHFHLLEQWRDTLIETGPAAAEDVMSKHPDADRQYIRQLITRAIKEQQINKPPSSARKLFQYLKELEQ